MLVWLQNHYFRMAEMVSAGGLVMGPLIVVSVAMWLLIVERVLFFRRLYYKNMSTAVALQHIRDARLPDSTQYCGVVSLLVREVVAGTSGDPEMDRHLLDAAVAKISRRLTNYLSVIGVLAAVAPLLGLLGTVTGMIATFDVLAIFGTGNAKAMAGGISEALITTQTGLIVAIPGLYMKGFLDRRAHNLQQRMARIGLYLRRQL